MQIEEAISVWTLDKGNSTLEAHFHLQQGTKKLWSRKQWPKRQRQNLGGVTTCAEVDYELWKTWVATVMKQYLGLVWEVTIVEHCQADLGPLRKIKQTSWSNITSPSSIIHFF